ncbi:hypothetical protein SAMN05444360_101381 [Chryseobacterium carnipullorum]|uniref:hypothetical protein n=1 Tax=Chryseobacterium carnipullorum TaxID=1124835 RepID=UPI000919F4F5|nr:hypothetical protein [Chryseobacterium carnipullorum]SHL39450.1 hypothetical protein SAMN05444360_101381 [Chryseobacterium carnipullorum]
MENNNLLFHRLRSIRSRKRTAIKDVEKQIRKKYKRSKELWHLRRNIRWIPLENPYQRGFVRFFVVNDEVKRSEDEDLFEGILKKINTYMYSESRLFLKKRKKFGRRIYVEKAQKLNRISFYAWTDPKFGLTPRERQYFLKNEEYNPFRKRNETYYEFIEPWRFTLRIRPNMITHYKPVDAELEKEYAEIELYISQYKVAGIIQKTINGKSNAWKKEYETELIKSRKYASCILSAKEIADYFEDL